MTAGSVTPPPNLPHLTVGEEQVVQPTELPALPIAIAAALATGAGTWMAGGLFNDPWARAFGFLGVLVGAGLVWFSVSRKAHLLPQLLVLPAAAILGAIVVLPFAPNGSTLPKLVTRAVHGAGFLQPPVPFDPGWKFVLIVLCAGLAATAASLALALGRPRVAVAVPLVLVLPAAVIQPDSAAVWSAAGALLLGVMALAAARNAELSLQGELSLSFEANRLARTGAAALALLLVLVLVSKAGLGLGASSREQVIPAHRPEVVPPPADQVLFTYQSPRSLPLRMGVLSIYDGTGWLIPEFDPNKEVTVQPGSQFPQAPSSSSPVTMTVTLGALEGRSLPAPAGLMRLGGSTAVQLDPSTQAIRLDGKNAAPGISYTITVAAPPTSDQLQAAGAPPPDLNAFLKVPQPPAEVVQLLATAPNADRYSKLQYLRQQLYNKVVAEGQGKPVDVPPSRVGEMLTGAHATPYEITAAEALIARWAGIPARIGYGYEGGDALPGGAFAVHPVHAGTWLEAYFAGEGWVPLVGVPPHAAQTISSSQKNQAAQSQAANLSLVVYVPTTATSSVLLYEEIRYYLERILPIVALGLLLLWVYPAGLKLLRASRRRRWAGANPRRRIAVAYAEFRDRLRDLAAGDPSAPPLDFLESLAPDPEHADFAWLVTRAVWGDLRDALTEDDALAAEAMSRSLRKRVGAAQPVSTRLLSWVARTSLRHAYSDEVPNLGRVKRVTPGSVAAAAAIAMVVVMGLVTPAAAVSTATASDQLQGLVPTSMTGLELRLETSGDKVFKQVNGSVVAGGHVYTVRHEDIVEGSIQVEQLVPSLSTGDSEVKDGIQQNLGGGNFHDLATPQLLFDGNCGCAGSYRQVLVRDQSLHRYQAVYEEDLPGVRVYLWYPPKRDVLVVVALRSEFPQQSADALVLALVDYEQGVPMGTVPVPEGE